MDVIEAFENGNEGERLETDYSDCASPIYCDAINEINCLYKLQPRRWQIPTELATRGGLTCATSKQALNSAPGELHSIEGNQLEICTGGLTANASWWLVSLWDFLDACRDRQHLGNTATVNRRAAETRNFDVQRAVILIWDHVLRQELETRH
ncbi:hypothetical protein NDU88_003480 [Pleurodeles waltl]|uniref:Uncharacterized protein n=1 Tax=Pleurodeles waltl TaxID=8319 RepID=A0AAV7UYK4_PLEWA|nr:hypothetical protein NDU88_003480 [Pleurodeles waltl]